jgi:hypothetical protein
MNVLWIWNFDLFFRLVLGQLDANSFTLLLIEEPEIEFAVILQLSNLDLVHEILVFVTIDNWDILHPWLIRILFFVFFAEVMFLDHINHVFLSAVFKTEVINCFVFWSFLKNVFDDDFTFLRDLVVQST